MRVRPEHELVTVITPTYNGAAFVAETIETVLAQTYAPVEHVLVDDGSVDATRAIVEAYALRHPRRIRVLANDDRLGPCRRRNDALAVARGSFVAWLDHDDLWAPTKLARQVDALRRDPGAGFAYTQYEAFEGETRTVVETSALEADEDLLAALFTQGCFIASSTVLIRRSALELRGLRLRDSDFSFGDDFFLWLALSLDWRAVLVDEVLASLRRHAANESARLGRTNFHLKTARLLDEFLRTFPDAAGKLARARREGLAFHLAAAAAYELERGHKAAAAKHAAAAAAADPPAAGRYVLGRARRVPAALLRRVRRRLRSSESSA